MGHQPGTKKDIWKKVTLSGKRKLLSGKSRQIKTRCNRLRHDGYLQNTKNTASSELENSEAPGLYGYDQDFNERYSAANNDS